MAIPEYASKVMDAMWRPVAKHTPGRMEVRQYTSGGGVAYAIDAPDALRLSIAQDILSLGDARLFASATDMLDALKEARWAIVNLSAALAAKGIEGTIMDPIPTIDAAIAKAEGR